VDASVPHRSRQQVIAVVLSTMFTDKTLGEEQRDAMISQLKSPVKLTSFNVSESGVGTSFAESLMSKASFSMVMSSPKVRFVCFPVLIAHMPRLSQSYQI
jgi:hypothetical protein